jgi:lysophospholipase L1-like esterase
MKSVPRINPEIGLLEFVDVFTPMLGKDGLPQPEFYIEDGLHLTPAAYQLWREILRPYLR